MTQTSDALPMEATRAPSSGHGAVVATRFVATRLLDLDDPFVGVAAGWAMSPFHSRGFLKAMFETLGAAKGAEMVLIGVANGTGAPTALFPFTLQREGALRVVEGLGLGVADYYVPLTAPGPTLTSDEAKKMWRTVLSALPAADVLRLRNVPKQAVGLSHALTEAPFLRPMGHNATTVVFKNAAGQPIYDIKALSLNRPLRKWVRRLESEFGKVSFAAGETPAEIDALLEAMVSYRRDRFASLGRNDLLADPAAVAFYRRLALPDTGPPLARVYGLRAGDEIVGVIYGMANGDVFTSLISSMSPDARYRRSSLGIMAMYFAIADCLTRGDRAYDLSIGELSYKSRFDGELVELFEYRKALSPRGVLPALAGRFRTRVRVFLRSHPGLAARLRSGRQAPAHAEPDAQ
jgi:CelD/BcsL family acetyltransferase involved in cellulose biosynthesis